MFKLINFDMLFLLLLSTCAFAQTGFDIAPQNTATPTTSMNSSEFRSAVSSMSQQTTNSLNQQAKQLFPKPSTSKTPGALPGTPAQPVAPSAVDNSFSINNSNTPSSQPGAAPAAPSQGGDYTGFGPRKNDSKPSTPASSGSSGGWNINY